jgi:Ca-activated chloride channel family protein
MSVLALEFGNAGLLSLLVLVPVVVAGYVLAQRRRPRYAARFTNLDLLASVVPRTPSWRRHIPPVIYLTALATLLVAVSRPTIVTADATQEATVMLVLDVSGSMIATDVQPSRLAAAQQSARTFLDNVPKSLKVGLVAFSSEARLLAPPSTDRDPVRTGLASLNAIGATAMGDAITLAMNAAAGSKATNGSSPGGPLGGITAPTSPPTTVTPDKLAPTVILLLSDGKNTVGRDPLSAADDAKARKVQIFTIALGTDNGVAEIPDSNGVVQEIPVPPDPDTLQQVAARTGGKFFTAPTADQLRSVYANLGSKLGAEKHKHEITAWFAGTAVILLIVGGALALIWFARFP